MILYDWFLDPGKKKPIKESLTAKPKELLLHSNLFPLNANNVIACHSRTRDPVILIIFLLALSASTAGIMSVKIKLMLILRR